MQGDRNRDGGESSSWPLAVVMLKHRPTGYGSLQTLITLSFLYWVPLASSQASQTSNFLSYFYHTCNLSTSSNTFVNQTLTLNLTLSLESTAEGLQQKSSSSSSSLYGNITTPLNAMYQCRGDLTLPQCGECVKEASMFALQKCNNTSQAYVLLDGCVIRYQEMPFFDLDISSIVWGCDGDPHGYAGQNILTTYRHDVDKLLKSVIAAASSQENYFNTSSMSDGMVGAVRVYGLVQCMAYLSSDQCSFCLSSLNDFVSSSRNICSNTPGVRVHYPSCFLRYDDFPFYEEKRDSPTSGTNVVPPQASALPSSSPSPSSSHPHPSHPGAKFLLCIFFLYIKCKFLHVYIS